MDKGCNFEKLLEQIIFRSVSNNWDEAKREWVLDYIYTTNYGDNECLCGHLIAETCVLRNTVNGRQAVVGNVCVKKFMQIEQGDKIFQAFNRIERDNARALNEASILYAHEQGWIDDWKKGFYLNTWRKRKLSDAQKGKRIEINNKVIKGNGKGDSAQKASPLSR